MRRSDREVTELDEIVRIMEKCDVCRLAFRGEDYPYILPLNFGLSFENGRVILYFHGADKGKKYELLARDDRVSFEMDCAHRLVMEPGKSSCTCTMEYESVIGKGRLQIVPKEEKYEALSLLMKHYHIEDVSFQETVMAKTTVMKLAVEEVTGKICRKEQKGA